MAEHTFIHASSLPVAPEEAWGALQNPVTWASIGGVDAVGSATFDVDGNLSGFTFAATVAGRRYPGNASVASSTPPRSMTVDIDTSELLGRITVHLAPPSDPERVTVRLAVRSRSFMAGLMFSVVAGAIGNGFPQRVEAFSAGLGTAR